MRIELLADVVGINKAGEECHPYKGIRGEKKGFFSFTLSADNTTFTAITEQELRRRIEAGDFNSGGRIRMIQLGATSTSGAGALSVVRYKGRALPL